MHSMFDLTDRVAIVSGTASGMGQAMATAFAEAGAQLILLDINSVGNEETAHTLSQLGHRAIPVTSDVSSFADIDRLYELVDREFGRVDILGNVAGNGIPAGRLGRSDDIKGLALWLASDAASWITGAIIPMDGGNLAMNAGGGLLGASGHNLKV